MPSRCIFLFRALRACSTLLSRTNTCKCFPIVLLSLLWSGDPDDFRVAHGVNVGLRSGRARHSEATIGIVTMLRLTDRLGGELSKDGRARRGTGSRSRGGSGFGFHLFAETPELKSFYIDCFFDLIAGEVMGRGLVRPDHPRNSPGAVVLREFAPRRIAGEGA